MSGYCEADKVGEAISVRVETLSDLVRLASSLAGRMVVMPVYRFKSGKGSVYFLQMMYKDYYRCYGLPVIYYYVAEDDERDASQVKYIIARTDESGERIEVTDRARPGWVVVPVINLAEKPVYVSVES
ncbi:MAG: cren protein [Desulfurococcales archaeon]|nr:cren protein [Desulfurococcales archaeon]